MRDADSTAPKGSKPTAVSPGKGKRPLLPQRAGSPSQAEVTAYFGKEVQLQGLMIFDGTVHIDGRLDGEIRSEGLVVIGEHGTLRANVYARTVVCQGTVTGDLVAQDALLLLSPARLQGSIHTPRLVMEEGVTFNGTSLMGPVGRDSASP